MRPHRRQPNRLHCPWDSPGKNTGVGCHFLLQCMKVKSESEVAQLCPTLRDPMDCSLPGSSANGIFQARVLEWGAIAFSTGYLYRVPMLLPNQPSLHEQSPSRLNMLPPLTSSGLEVVATINSYYFHCYQQLLSYLLWFSLPHFYRFTNSPFQIILKAHFCVFGEK